MLDEKKLQSPLKKNHTDFEIVEYKPDYKIKYRDLNYEWLNKYFEIEFSDEIILSNPETEIIDKNGYIFFALFKGEAIGTCTLIKRDDKTYELSKMCVTEQYQRKGAGEKLLNEAISKAYKLGIEKIFLSTNRRLTAAFNLYRKKGFKIMNDPFELNSSYKRESISMCFNLNYDYAEE
jgi:N-acetylglutamate synthase-like GNAT family acetyltransferase